MTSLIAVAVAIFIGGNAGIMAHELTHYIVARVLGREPNLHADPIGLIGVSWIGPEGRADRRDAAIGGAPVLMGVLMLPVVALALVGANAPVAIALGIGWIAYTVPLAYYLPVIPSRYWYGASLHDIEYARLLLFGVRPSFETQE